MLWYGYIGRPVKFMLKAKDRKEHESIVKSRPEDQLSSQIVVRVGELQR